MREESDGLGTRSLPDDALHGIATLRAVENFPLSGWRVHPQLLRAFGAVKLAAARTNFDLGYLSRERFEPISAACQELFAGDLGEHVPVDALQGGAGTSTNLAVCEVIANRALVLAGRRPGDYDFVHPIEHVNLHQSTNDTFPTALRVAALWLLHAADADLLRLVGAFQTKERELDDVVKVGRTELQDAVLTTLGRSMAAFAEAFARDRWRVSKCIERLRVVNLGGTAIGTGVGAPRQYIFRVVDQLRTVSRVGVARSENLVDATQNLDALVEVMGILKAWACNLVKVGNDLRLMASGPEAGLGEVNLPVRQTGSSIMPGKVNPVIPEAAVQAGFLVMGYEHSLSTACAAGNLELNAFMPLVAHSLLHSIEILANASRMLAASCVEGLDANRERCAAHVESSSALATALVSRLGYVKACELLAESRRSGISFRETCVRTGLLTATEFDDLTSAAAVLRLGG